MIEAVVWDIGNVLIEWHPHRPFDARIGPAARERLFAEVDLMGMNHRVDAGAELGPEMEALYALHPHHAEHIAIWRDAMPETLGPHLARNIRLLRALKARGVAVHALSNWGRESFAERRSEIDFLRLFDHATVSGEVGLVKPDDAIYAHHEAATGFAGAQLLFVDDRAENVEAAARRGWHIHHFTGDEAALAARLVAEGLLTEAEAA